MVVLAVSLAGILAMHGMSVTDAAGAHRSPIALGSAEPTHHGEAVTGTDRVPGGSAAGLRATHPTVDAAAPPGRPSTALGPAGDHSDHAAMAGCIAVLLGLIGAIALRLRHVGRTGGRALPVAGLLIDSGGARAPPRPIFLSLCVFRL
ncbi:MAG TPA: hypothetical protein VD813_03290 [Pseudonocardia sp.]|nr:hypothetical protein [Pseudonocardia sp.]